MLGGKRPRKMEANSYRSIIFLFGVCVLTLLSLIFSASESAFLSINKLRIRFLRGNKNDGRAALCAKLLDNREKLLHTLLVANNIVNIALTAMLTSAALELFGNAGIGIATSAATVILLLFGEIGPKTIAADYPEPTAMAFSRFISVMVAALSPLTALLGIVTGGFSRKTDAGGKNPKRAQSFTVEEIKTFIDIGEEEGVLEKREKTMMHKALSFTDIAASEIMIPRTDIVFITPDSSYRKILELSDRTRLSRFPVCADGIDDIAGILYVKDMLAYKDSPESFSVQKVRRPPLFIPATKKISVVQQILRQNKQSLAVIVDEYSGTAGVLSVEDIAKEIFGTIADEYDIPQKRDITKTGEGEYVCDASVKLSTVAEKTGIRLESRFYETLAGFMLERLDAVPQAGDKVIESGAVFTAAEVTEQKIKTVHIDAR
jgi:CBS domain containing-hemolysin-like protein